MKTIFSILIFGVVVVVLFLGFHHAYPPIATNPAPTTQATSPSTDTGINGSTGPDYTPTDETSSTDISTWKTYSTTGGFVFFNYPSDWTLSSGATLTSPKGDMKIVATYVKGSDLPACDPTTCRQVTINTLDYNRILQVSNSGVKLIYVATKLGYLVTVTATMPNDTRQVANTALADEIMSTVNVQ